MQIIVVCIILLACTVAYWLGRNRTAKARILIGLVFLTPAALLGAWARSNPDAPFLNSELPAYAYLAVFIIFLVTGVGLPVWALHDALMSKFFQR
jgi:hypothetical protein